MAAEPVAESARFVVVTKQKAREAQNKIQPPKT